MQKPKQERSRRTLERIIAGAIGEFASKAPREVTIKDVVSRSQTSVGSFYARFEGKEDLITAVDTRLWDDVRSRWVELHVSLRLGENQNLRSHLVEPLSQVFSPDAAARRAIRLELAWTGRGSRGDAVLDEIRAGIGEALGKDTWEGSTPQPAGVAEFLARLVLWTLRDGELPAEAIGHLCHVLETALGGSGEGLDPTSDSAGSTRSGVDPFDIWG